MVRWFHTEHIINGSSVAEQLARWKTANASCCIQQPSSSYWLWSLQMKWLFILKIDSCCVAALNAPCCVAALNTPCAQTEALSSVVNWHSWILRPHSSTPSAPLSPQNKGRWDMHLVSPRSLLREHSYGSTLSTARPIIPAQSSGSQYPQAPPSPTHLLSHHATGPDFRCRARRGFYK